jgi:HK97 family phage major capsid protein
VAYQAGKISEQAAKHEIEACRLFRNAMQDTNNEPAGSEERSIFLPICADYLADGLRQTEGFKVIKSMMDAGNEGYDPDEATWTLNRIRKAQSYLIQTEGGSLVAPPAMGELIELMRPNLAVANAGATQVPLPAQGAISYPRQTGPSTMYWIGENTSITESAITTGRISLQGKKGAVFLGMPNELLKFSSVAADGLFRSDMSKTLALGFDYATLYGSGGASQPKGLVSYTGTNQLIDYAALTPAPTGVATDGNKLRPEDASRMIGLIEDRNFQFSGWIMRPTLANATTGYRADAVSAGDAAGTFVTNLMRSFSEKMPGNVWGGYPVSKSATVRNDQTKGSGTGLTEVFGGQWEHLLQGMYGAVEITSSNVAGNALQTDQTYVRAVMICDAVPRYEGAFIWYKALLNSGN